mmetsp:Transcript_20264/g.77801  ORF Transcript_20264/g.77801 Transcript_20264/m.77801 type:complete len:261 (-) Transcript_20264:904-1686(-)
MQVPGKLGVNLVKELQGGLGAPDKRSLFLGNTRQGDDSAELASFAAATATGSARGDWRNSRCISSCGGEPLRRSSHQERAEASGQAKLQCRLPGDAGREEPAGGMHRTAAGSDLVVRLQRHRCAESDRAGPAQQREHRALLRPQALRLGPGRARGSHERLESQRAQPLLRYGHVDGDSKALAEPQVHVGAAAGRKAPKLADCSPEPGPIRLPHWRAGRDVGMLDDASLLALALQSRRRELEQGRHDGRQTRPGLGVRQKD